MATAITQYQKQVVDYEAQRFGVPTWVIEGVWGMETDFGANVSTSSAGAMGDFQFLPSTAKLFGYPLTNSPNQHQFTRQAESAAKYLSQLYKQHGHNWDAAIKAYSGGGYGAAQVRAKASGNPFKPISVTGAVAQGATSVWNTIPHAISGVWNSAVGDAKYAALLVAALVLGALMIFHGVKGPGQSGRPVIVPVPA